MTERPDILARVVVLLLGLAMLAERATSQPRGVRLALLHILLPAQHRALALMDMSPDAEDADAFCALDKRGALLHLAIVFRALAALFVHACLTESRAASAAPRYPIALLPALIARPSQCRIGMVHDTS